MDSFRDPFASNLQKYMHSSHIKSIESNSSDEYDLQGTATKHKKNQHFNQNTRIQGAQNSNIFNREAEHGSGEAFLIKRSLPTNTHTFAGKPLGHKKFSENSGKLAYHLDKENFDPRDEPQNQTKSFGLEKHKKYQNN